MLVCGAAAAGPLRVVFFMSPTCDHCLKVKAFLPGIIAKWRDAVVIEERNLQDSDDVYLEQVLYEEHYGVETTAPPIIFVGARALIGDDEIIDGLDGAIAQGTANGATTFQPFPNEGDASDEEKSRMALEAKEAARATVISRFQSFSVGTIAAAGLVDGINPCAFTTIIFFLSMLGYLGKSKRDLIMVGVGFTSAIFATYLLLGFGLLTAVSAFAVGRGSSMIIGYAVAMLAFALAAWCVVDVVRYVRSKDVKKMKLGLPKLIKLGVHKVIRQGLTSRRLVLGSVVVGFLVALLESVCTGQTYLPIVHIINTVPTMRVSAISYLLLYNLMFILPLAAILIMGYFGVTSKVLGQLLRRHLVAMKLTMAVMFATLGVVVFLTISWL